MTPFRIGGIWRHGQRLPAGATMRRLTLGEGDTPLVHLPRWGAANGLRAVYAKLEYANPTGSFKDRGMVALVAVALEGGATHIVEDSSGNAGASAAAYAARAGLTCTVYAPAAAPEAKLRQIRAYGAELVEVGGPRSAVTDAAREAGARPGAYYVAHNENDAFVPGNKTFAYEIAEAFGAAAAELHVVIPVGGGALFCGAWLGFTEGEMAPRVRMHAAQSTSCAPIAEAWRQNLDAPAAIERKPSACGGIEIERPARGQAILRAIRDSRGTATASDEASILAERDRLAQLEGIYAEPTSAAALAALAQLAGRGAVGADDTVVVAITGSGLKDPGPVAERAQRERGGLG